MLKIDTLLSYKKTFSLAACTGTTSRACGIWLRNRQFLRKVAAHSYLAEEATLQMDASPASPALSAESSSRWISVSPAVGAMPWSSFCVVTQAWSSCLVMKTCASLSLALPFLSVGERMLFIPPVANSKNGRISLGRRLPALRPCRSCHAVA